MTTPLILTVEVKCPTCGAEPRQRCAKNGPAYRFHAARTEAAKKAMADGRERADG